MRKLLKVILPPFIGFAAFFIAVRYSGEYFKLTISDMGGGDLLAFMAYYRYLLPLLFVVGVLTQLLIIVPIWNSVLRRPIAAKVTAFLSLTFVCLLFAFGLSYPISDVQHHPRHFVKVLLFMALVQLVYWVIDLAVLYLLDHKEFKPPIVTDTAE